jgi:hypothetical protein
LFRSHGSLLSFELKDGIDCFDFLNRLKLAMPASNLGDTRTLVIPVAHTIFFEMGAERRASMGIAESLITGLGRDRGHRRPARRLRLRAGGVLGPSVRGAPGAGG